MVIQASKEFVPVFVDTLKDIKTTKRFNEKYGSYPVLRVHNFDGQDIAGRIDGNRVAGNIPVVQVVKQMHYAQALLARAKAQQQVLDAAQRRRPNQSGNQNPSGQRRAPGNVPRR